MSVKHNYPKFEKFWDVRQDEWDEQQLRTFKEILLEAYRQIILRSPVDTGLYRSSHTISFGAPDTTLPPGASQTAKGRGKALQGKGFVPPNAMIEALAILAAAKRIPEGGLKAYITTALDYSRHIEARFAVYGQAAHAARELLAREGFTFGAGSL